MKRTITALLTALLLALSLCVPAAASVEYGSIFDETEELGSAELTYQGEQELPQLAKNLGIDLRVDVFTDEGLEPDDTVSDIATYVYGNYDYGLGEDREGVSLTLLMKTQPDGSYALAEDDWCVYAFLSETRGSSQELSDAVYAAIKPYMAAQAWNGEDMTMSATALSQAVDAMMKAASDYILANCPPDNSGEVTETQPQEQTEVDMKYIFDISDLHTVFFCPEDLFLIRAGAAERRRFMDLSLCQLRPRYAEALAEYTRLHEHKTRILRDSEEHPQLLQMLPDFNERLCRVGAVLISYRARYCVSLAEYARQAHFECSGEKEELTLLYRTVKTVEDPFAPQEQICEALRRHQEAHLAAERASRLCLSGPHKDDVEVLINRRSARQYGSQGQVRTAALSLKLAEREIHKNAVGEYPVMLLDDVLSELDPRRQEYVLNRIQGGQVFITCCENDRLDTMLHGRVFHIRNGEVL